MERSRSKIVQRIKSPHLPDITHQAGSVTFDAVAICITLAIGLLSVPTATLAAKLGASATPAANVEPLIGTGRGPGGKENLSQDPRCPLGWCS